MFLIKNVSGMRKIWGGVIFEQEQERYDVPREDLASDSCFLQAVLEEKAQVTVDGMLIQDALNALDAIRNGNKLDEQGTLIARIRQVPDSFIHCSKTIEFTTGNPTSLRQNWWPMVEGNECSLTFKRSVGGILQECLPSQAEYTIVTWSPVFQTMPKRAQIRLLEQNESITAWIGIAGQEHLPQGRLYMRNSFKMDRVWSIEVMEPRVISQELIMFIGHPVGASVDVEMMMEYFTNYESIG